MDKRAIGAGDLVAIVRPYPCCQDDRHVGEMFTVKAVGVHDVAFCAYCGIRLEQMPFAQAPVWQHPLQCLQKIYPMGAEQSGHQVLELETV